MSGVPAWARDASAPEPLRLLDVVLEVCRAFPAYTVEALLDVPVRRFWHMVSNVSERRAQLNAAAKENPLGAMAMMAGER